METIKVFVVDDHLIFRNGLIGLLQELSTIEIVGEASNGIEFLEKFEILKPDIVLMDITMPKMNGIEATKEAVTRNPEIKIIALSMHEEEEYLDSMLFAGAKGFLLKKVGLNELEKAIEVVMDGKNYYSQELMTIFTNKVLLPSELINGDALSISKREHDVLKHICLGLSNQEISEKLFISPRTVENHRAHLIEKTSSRNTVGLVIFSIKNKIVSL